MTPIVRFAPSPTGLLHIGNARPALLNWLFALKQDGRFILRFDDTDRERSTKEFADGIARDLAWLGVQPHQTVAQSARFALYDAAADRLRAIGRLYACYETPDELERRRKRQLARGLPPVYDRAGLKLTADERAKLEAEGRKPHWRFLLEDRQMVWQDLVRSECHVDSASLSDPVLIRADGTYLYTLPSVVDDVDMGITHVIRGEDHVTNTGVQIQIIEALGGAVPTFAHHNLLTTASGEGLSKRLGHLSLQGLREKGMEPLAVAALSVLVGSADAVRPVESLQELASLVDLAHISRAPAKFDEAELAALNSRTIHQMSFGAAAARLAALGVTGGEAFWLAVRGNLARLDEAADWWRVVSGKIAPVVEDAGFASAARASFPEGDVTGGEAFWLAVRGNLARLDEAADWWRVVSGKIAPVVEDAGFASAARASFPEGDVTGETWKLWTEAVKAATGAKGRALFMPLRLALTGRDHGPELAPLLPLMGRERILARLGGETA
jgi:glutamyl-tRNA synthetase